MADEKRTALLKFEIDQGDGLTELARLKDVIASLKAEKKELDDAVKKGTITQKEWATEIVRVEALIKKNNSAYNDQQRAVTGTKNVLKELIKSNQDLSKELKNNQTSLASFSKQAGNAAKDMNVAGVSFNSVTNSLKAFASPGAAAVGIVGGLASAYAASAAGARDLQEAQDKLTAATTIASNAWGSFIDTLSGGDGSGKKGFFSSLTDEILLRINPGLKAMADLAANAKRSIKELEITDIEAKRRAKQSLDDAEAARRDRDNQEKEIEQRYQAAIDVTTFINEREATLVQVQEDILKQLNTLLSIDKENLELKKAVKQVEFEIADIREDSQGKRTEALNAELALEKEIAQQRRDNARGGARGGAGANNLPVAVGQSVDNLLPEDKLAANSKRYLTQVEEKLRRQNRENEREDYDARIEMAKLFRDQQLDAAIQISGAIASLFGEQTAAYKAAATGETLISTYAAATKAYEAAFVPPTPASPALGAAFAAAAILNGLGNVARINGVEFAEGGWTGPGDKWDVAGVVHADEYVVPKRIVHSPTAQHHLNALESMRLTPYADGGLVTNSIINASNPSMLMNQMIAKMSEIQIVAEVKEVAKGLNRLQTKQGAVKIGGRKVA